MRYRIPAGAIVLVMVVSVATAADSIWARREPRSAFLFEDNRARRVGDLLTIDISEITDVNEREKRDLAKATSFADKFDFKANSAAGKNMTRSGSASLDQSGASERTFNGSAQFSSGRTFTDRVTVTVIDVLPNSNLVVEGSRTRMVSGEMRTLRVTGIVRPADIGSGNSVESQFVGNFHIIYTGRGIETNVTQPSLFKRVLFRVWPN